MADTAQARLRTTVLRTLHVDGALPGGAPFISAASGLARTGDGLVIAADDAHHIGVFPAAGEGPGRLVRLLPGDLPDDPRERKRRKPDFEALVTLPAAGDLVHGALVAVGSGSTPARETAVVVGLDAQERLTGDVRPRALGPLVAGLRERAGEINVEAAFTLDDALVLVSRGHAAAPRNHVVHLALADVARWLAGDPAPLAPLVVRDVTLPPIGDVPLTITDGAPHPSGGWVFSAVAEDTASSYDDGALAGAAVGAFTRTGTLAFVHRLDRDLKVEGIVAAGGGRHVTVTMVTDADDPQVPATLLRATIPPDPGRPRDR